VHEPKESARPMKGTIGKILGMHESRPSKSDSPILCPGDRPRFWHRRLPRPRWLQAADPNRRYPPTGSILYNWTHLPHAQLVTLSWISPQRRQIQTVKTAKGSLCSQSQRWAFSFVCSVNWGDLKMLKRDSTSPLRLARLFARPDEQALATAMRKRPYQ
jgi:hypothetical protein